MSDDRDDGFGDYDPEDAIDGDEPETADDDAPTD